MKILYVVTGVSGDERAIIKALQVRGHQVEKIFHVYMEPENTKDFDLILFNHSRKIDKISRCLPPKVCWCFDLIEHPTWYPDLIATRRVWALNVINMSNLAFFTDGNFVSRAKEACYTNVHWLLQGSQEVIDYITEPKNYDILLATSIMERERQEFKEQLVKSFNHRNVKTVDGKGRIYGTEFAKLISQSRVVVAPDMPIKSHYWSNRVWMVLGYGGTLLHPHIPALASLLKDGEHIVYYRDRNELYEKIEELLQSDNCSKIGQRGMEQIAEAHTYQHQVDRMLLTIDRELNIK